MNMEQASVNQVPSLQQLSAEALVIVKCCTALQAANNKLMAKTKELESIVLELQEITAEQHDIILQYKAIEETGYPYV